MEYITNNIIFNVYNNPYNVNIYCVYIANVCERSIIIVNNLNIIYIIYERQKQKLQKMNLTSKQYEAAIKILAEKLNI